MLVAVGFVVALALVAGAAEGFVAGAVPALFTIGPLPVEGAGAVVATGSADTVAVATGTFDDMAFVAAVLPGGALAGPVGGGAIAAVSVDAGLPEAGSSF